jgi:hypothetical protein
MEHVLANRFIGVALVPFDVKLMPKPSVLAALAALATPIQLRI